MNNDNNHNNNNIIIIICVYIYIYILFIYLFLLFFFFLGGGLGGWDPSIRNFLHPRHQFWARGNSAKRPSSQNPASSIPTRMGYSTLESLKRPFIGFIMGVVRPSSPSW